MKALALNCTLKRSPDDSNTAALTRVVLDALAERGVETDMVRVADHIVEPGVVSEAVTDADEWPAIREKVVAADIIVVYPGYDKFFDGLHHISQATISSKS